MGSFVSHLECSLTGETYPAREARGLSRAGWPLLVRYDLPALKAALSKDALRARSGGLWRYGEWLPVEMEKNRLTLGEAMTPLVRMQRIEALRGGAELFIKDESRLPAGTAQARGAALAAAMAKELRVKRLALAADDAYGAAVAAYATRAGLHATVFCPLDADPGIIDAVAIRGADVRRVNGSIADCARIVREGAGKTGWFDVSALSEPYFLEGMKTAGFELAEQSGWELPDWIVHPADEGVIGLAKAFDELEAIGWIGAKRPKMIAVDARAGAPVLQAWERGDADAQRAYPPRETLIARAVRASGGFCVAVDEAGAERALTEMAREEGVVLGRASAAAFAAYLGAVLERRFRRSDRVVLFNSGAVVRHPAADAGPVLDPHAPLDYAQFRISTSGDD
jgi:threonine synthase